MLKKKDLKLIDDFETKVNIHNKAKLLLNKHEYTGEPILDTDGNMRLSPTFLNPAGYVIRIKEKEDAVFNALTMARYENDMEWYKVAKILFKDQLKMEEKQREKVERMYKISFEITQRAAIENYNKAQQKEKEKGSK